MAEKTILDCKFVKAQPKVVEIGIKQAADDYSDLYDPCIIDALAADYQAREDAWNGYFCEAVRGGMTSTEASLYANAMMVIGEVL